MNKNNFKNKKKNFNVGFLNWNYNQLINNSKTQNINKKFQKLMKIFKRTFMK